MRGGQRPEDLARKFEPSADAIRNWVVQAASDERQRADGLTTDEKKELRSLRREVRVLREEREILKKIRDLVLRGDHVDPLEGFEFMNGHQADHPIASMCRVLGAATSGYYAWQHRAPSPRARQDAELTMKIHTIHLIDCHHSTVDSPGDPPSQSP